MPVARPTRHIEPHILFRLGNLDCSGHGAADARLARSCLVGPFIVRRDDSAILHRNRLTDIDPAMASAICFCNLFETSYPIGEIGCSSGDWPFRHDASAREQRFSRATSVDQLDPFIPHHRRDSRSMRPSVLRNAVS